MKKLFTLLTLLSALFTRAQTNTAKADSLAAFGFADSVFTRTSFTYETVEPDIPADMQSILIKFNSAVTANKQWFLDYRDKYAAGGQPLPYNERFGITREEYQRVQNMEKLPPHLVPVSQKKVVVLRKDGGLHLKGEGDSHILDYLEIDLQRQKIIFAGDTIPFQGATNAGPSSPFGQWNGYVWRLQNTDLRASLQAGQATARVVEIDLGLPAQNDKVFLRIIYQDIQDGITRADMDLAGYIR